MSRVVAIAGVGRNTFYECFDDFEHALRAARSESAKRMSEVLAAVARDEQWVDELARAWVATVLDEPLLALAALQVPPARSLSKLGSALGDVLTRAALQRQSALDAGARLGVELAVAAGEACARGIARAAVARLAEGSSPPDGPGIGAGLEPSEIATALADSVRASLSRVLGDEV